MVVSSYRRPTSGHAQGPKGFTGDFALAEAKLNDEIAGGLIPDNDDPERLLRAQLEAVAKVVDEAQERIDRLGIGFKGLLPAYYVASCLACHDDLMRAVLEESMKAFDDSITSLIRGDPAKMPLPARNGATKSAPARGARVAAVLKTRH